MPPAAGLTAGRVAYAFRRACPTGACPQRAAREKSGPARRHRAPGPHVYAGGPARAAREVGASDPTERSGASTWGKRGEPHRGLDGGPLPAPGCPSSTGRQTDRWRGLNGTGEINSTGTMRCARRKMRPPLPMAIFACSSKNWKQTCAGGGHGTSMKGAFSPTGRRPLASRLPLPKLSGWQRKRRGG